MLRQLLSNLQVPASVRTALVPCTQECNAALSLRALSSQQASTSASPELESMDKVLLKGLVFHGYHGVLPEENVLGQKFVVDATLYTNLRDAGISDNLADTINYAAVYSEVKTVMEGPPFKLLEAAAETLCQRILCFDGRIQAVRVELRKPHVAVTGTVDALGIEITRMKQQLQQQR